MKQFPTGKLARLKNTLTWEEWLNCWNQADTLPTALGLLHGVFQLSLGHEHDLQRYVRMRARVRFLLILADGRGIEMDQTARIIRNKAFQVLADGFFKPRASDRDLGLGGDGDLLDHLLWFFRVTWKDREDTTGRMLSNSGYFDTSLHLTDACERYRRQLFKTIFAHVQYGLERRLQVLELAVAHNNVEIISEAAPYRNPEELFDDAILARLEHIVARRSETVEEGMFARHPEAQLLWRIRYDLRRRAQIRRESELKNQIASAEAELQQL